MPTSKKRVKKDTVHEEVAVKNPLKTTTGKVIIITLALAFLLSGLVGLIVMLIQYSQLR